MNKYETDLSHTLCETVIRNNFNYLMLKFICPDFSCC